MVFPVDIVVVLAPEVNVSVLEAALLEANSVQADGPELNAFTFKEVSVPTISPAVYPNVALLQVEPAVRFPVV